MMDEGDRLLYVRHGFVEYSRVPDTPNFLQSEGDIKRDGPLIMMLAGG